MMATVLDVLLVTALIVAILLRVVVLARPREG
jgi:hypothetical protein